MAVGLIRDEASSLDVLGFTDLVEDRLNSTDSPLAEGFQAEITADFATGVRQQLSSLTRNLFTGLLAVAAVSLLLIGWRVGVLTAGFMTLVLMGSLVGLWAVGYSLNTITLFGLILTLGLLVDDAIVISESIDANRDDPDPGEDIESVGVVKRAIDRVGAASFAGTLTTVVVFSPMLFIDTQISTDGSIARTDGARYIEVRAKYDEDSAISGILASTEDLLAAQYSGEALQRRGLTADALSFDFGLESDNQDDFAGLAVAGLVALALMLLLLTIQFRSLAQPLLILLVFPAFSISLEWVRTWARNLVRGWSGKPLINY
jgi:multidrug efflux pump subunit AcrB